MAQSQLLKASRSLQASKGPGFWPCERVDMRRSARIGLQRGVRPSGCLFYQVLLRYLAPGRAASHEQQTGPSAHTQISVEPTPHFRHAHIHPCNSRPSQRGQRPCAKHCSARPHDHTTSHIAWGIFCAGAPATAGRGSAATIGSLTRPAPSTAFAPTRPWVEWSMWKAMIRADVEVGLLVATP